MRSTPESGSGACEACRPRRSWSALRSVLREAPARGTLAAGSRRASRARARDARARGRRSRSLRVGLPGYACGRRRRRGLRRGWTGSVLLGFSVRAGARLRRVGARGARDPGQHLRDGQASPPPSRAADGDLVAGPPGARRQRLVGWQRCGVPDAGSGARGRPSARSPSASVTWLGPRRRLVVARAETRPRIRRRRRYAAEGSTSSAERQIHRARLRGCPRRSWPPTTSSCRDLKPMATAPTSRPALHSDATTSGRSPGQHRHDHASRPPGDGPRRGLRRGVSHPGRRGRRSGPALRCRMAPRRVREPGQSFSTRLRVDPRWRRCSTGSS